MFIQRFLFDIEKSSCYGSTWIIRINFLCHLLDREIQLSQIWLIETNHFVVMIVFVLFPKWFRIYKSIDK